MVDCKWDFGDTLSGSRNTSLQFNPGHLFSDEGTYHVTLVLKNSVGDSVVIEKDIEVKNLPQKVLPPKIISSTCEPLMLDAGNPGARFLWNTGDTVQAVKVYTPGMYRVKITNAHCSLDDSAEVIHQAPKLNLPDSLVLCQGDSIILDAGADSMRYTWSSGDTTRQTTISQYGIYWLRVQKKSCLAYDTVKIIPPPHQDIPGGRNFSLCGERHIWLSAPEGSAFHWLPGGEGTRDIFVALPGRYKVSYRSPFGCDKMDSFMVTKDCDVFLYVPNAFTPNGRQGNESFIPLGINVAEFEMKIFNRWGEQVFYSDNLSVGWTGTFKEKAAPEGIYLYIIQYKGAYSSMQMKTGTLTLMR